MAAIDKQDMAAVKRMETEAEAVPAKAKAKTEFGPSVIHLLRTVHQQHIQLSAMADQKANIIIGVAMVVQTLTLAQLRHGEIPAPLLILSISTLVAALLAIVSVIPHFTRKPLQPSQVNPLFFGNFARMTEGEFIERMMTVIDTDRSIFETMLSDMYQLGKVLYWKKYRWLSYSYWMFGLGLVTATLSAITGFTFGG